MPIVPWATPDFRAVCDKCRDAIPFPALNDDAARKFAKTKGWKIEGDVVTCHRCLVREEVKS
jgi:hypothetical protein